MKLTKIIPNFKKISITQYFLVFAATVIILSASTYFYFSQKIYSEQAELTLKDQALRIEGALMDNIEYSAYLMQYLGDRVKNKDVRDLQYIRGLLSSFGLKSALDNTTTWNMFSWVDDKMDLVVNSNSGVVNPVSIKNRDYVPMMIAHPREIHLGKPSYGRVSGEWIIPAGMGFVDSQNKYIGAIVFGFQVDKLSQKLKKSIVEDDISFAVLDYDMNQVMNSNYFSSNPDFTKLIRSAIESPNVSGKMSKFWFLGKNENFGFYQKIEKHRYIIVVKRDNMFSSREIDSRIHSYLLEIFTIFTILGLILYVLRKMIISPISKISTASQLIAQDRDEEVMMPQSNIVEIIELTEQVKLIERYKLNLLHAKKSQERFFANMSHELRTPLNGILNFSLMMKKEMFGPLDPEYKEMASDVHSSGMHLLNLVNDILDFSKMDIGKMKLNEEEFDTVEEVGGALKIVLSDNDRYGVGSPVKIVSEVNLKNINLRGDRRMFKQILLNLLSNASKFVEAGSITLKLFVDEKKNLVLEVHDTGIGIKEEDLAKLAIEFGQVGNGFYRGKRQGSGLGLFLVKKMAELHQGIFEIKSIYGKGTTVRVVFPAERLITNNNALNDSR